MDWERLFALQAELDARIKKEHNLTTKDVVSDKVLALLVEISELANETRCFKFWSKKGPNEKSIILEEYVDGLHFIISLGIEMNYFYQEDVHFNLDSSDRTGLFIKTYEKTLQFQKEKSEENYEKLFLTFLQLGQALDLEWDMIQQAYISKNEVNHERQDQGY